MSYPPDSLTLEILLCEQDGRSHDMPFMDVKRFDSVDELMVFLDKLSEEEDLSGID